MNTLTGRIGIVLLAMALLIVILLAAGYAYIYYKQDSIIFPGAWMDLPAPELSGFPGAEPVEIDVGDGAVLRGWFLRANGGGRKPLLIYFGGNGEGATANAPLFVSMLEGWSVLLVDYRGFGRSTGEPSEEAIFSDALILYDRFATRADVQPEAVALMGRSLGTGVATYLASERPARAVVLVSPYDSFVSLGRRYYPRVPSFLVRHRFDSLSLAPGIDTSVLTVVGTHDRLIPPECSRRLADAWGGKADVLELDGANHFNIYYHPGFWPGIRGYLQGLGLM
jgi:pimeloyl-ACP methyl ester carboxylesterase